MPGARRFQNKHCHLEKEAGPGSIVSENLRGGVRRSSPLVGGMVQGWLLEIGGINLWDEEALFATLARGGGGTVRGQGHVENREEHLSNGDRGLQMHPGKFRLLVSFAGTKCKSRSSDSWPEFFPRLIDAPTFPTLVDD